MKIQDSYIDKQIGINLLVRNKEEQKDRVPSGKLSAGSLGDTVQWQVLKYLGVVQEPFDEYTLRKFKRGKDIEEWLVKELIILGIVRGEQEKVEYMGCIGFLDVMVDTKDWDFNKGIIPLEVKSVTNFKFKRIVKESSPQKGHILQNCYYALGKEKEWFAIAYVASDDLRVQTYVLEVKDFKKEVEQSITTFQETIMAETIPVFEAKEKWQENKQYSRYPDWQELTKEELAKRSKELFAKKETK